MTEYFVVYRDRWDDDPCSNLSFCYAEDWQRWERQHSKAFIDRFELVSCELTLEQATLMVELARGG